MQIENLYIGIYDMFLLLPYVMKVSTSATKISTSSTKQLKISTVELSQSQTLQNYRGESVRFAGELMGLPGNHQGDMFPEGYPVISMFIVGDDKHL